MRACITVLVLPLIVGFASGNSQQIRAVHTGQPNAVTDKASKSVDCADPKGYSVDEGIKPGTHPVNIVRDGRVLYTIELPTGVDINGFGFDGAKKTKAGFEISIEYGSVIYYHKAFVFICRHHKFYLSKIRVDSFNKHNPEKWSKKVVTVRPNLPLEKFLITDFMREGVVK
jgi:hypothetical protein